jgi:hypothetical protein
MSCPTSNHDKEQEYFDGIPVKSPEDMKDYWYKRYMNVLWENEALKKQLMELKLSRIDVIGQNGNGGEHYDEAS